MKVCHMTTVHDRFDDRIFLKECISLNKFGYDVFLVAKGNNEEINGVTILGLQELSNSRILRFLSSGKRAYKIAKNLNADVYHFHDPELIPFAKKLKKKGKVVIYDSHEDVPRQILAKEWIPLSLRKFVSMVFEKYEKSSASTFDLVISATPYIADRFLEKNCNTKVIKNYPILTDITGENGNYSSREKIICYAGGISEVRGISNILNIIENIDTSFSMAGAVDNDYLLKLKNKRGWAKTNFVGYLNRKELNDFYNISRIGMVILLDTPNHVNSLPIKLFEYMCAGLPVICSNFPICEDIVKTCNCGIIVDPSNLKEIEAAILYLLDNQDIAKEMGDNGKLAVEKLYNWDIEESKLLNYYKTLLEG